MFLTFYSEWVGAIATCVGAIGTIVSLIFLYHQVKGLKSTIENSESSSYLNMLELMVSIDRFFIDKPELKPYFYNNKEVDAKDPIEKDRLESVAEMMMDFFEAVYHQKGSLPVATFNAYKRYMRRIYEHSPVLKDFLGKNEWGQLYPEQFIRAVTGGVKTFPEGKDKYLSS
jgi:hypothetical protein